MITFGQWLRAAREQKRHLSLRATARAVGISPAFLSDIELDRRVPSKATAQRLATHLGCDVQEIHRRLPRLSNTATDLLRRNALAREAVEVLAHSALADRQDEMEALLTLLFSGRSIRALLKVKVK